MDMEEILKRAEAQRAKDAEDLERMQTDRSWEPSYGFCAYKETDRIVLAATLEALRRRVCAYGGGNRCDCKYGLTIDLGAVLNEFNITPEDGIPAAQGRFSYSGTKGNSEQTGCPELREIIHRLLHRDLPLF